MFIITQSKASNADIEIAILNIGLKSTYTPCVMLRKGVDNNNLTRIVNLPDIEGLKSFRLLLELFKVAYTRKFDAEKNAENKWWYWDLSDSAKEELVYKNFS